MQRKENTLCRLHTLRAIQLGSCITCRSASPICETKGCIKHHLESEKMHTSYTVREIQKITDQYTSSNEEKRNILLKMVNQYFQALKAEVEALYHQATHAIDNLRFENYLLSEKQRKLAELLVTRRYSELLCEDVAAIIPKMLKVASFEEKQFNYLKDFLVSEREGLNKTVSTLVLNLPYFRDDQSHVSLEKFTVVAEEKLNNVNARLQALTFRPRKLRIMYSNSLTMQVMTTQLVQYAGHRTIAYKVMRFRGTSGGIQERFIHLLETSEHLKEVQALEFYCTWNINEEDYQIEFMDAVLALPYLSAFTIYTGYKMTSTDFIEEMTENKNIEMKVYLKEWHF